MLVGHSDGGSIALIHAARHPVSGLVLLAPHVFVEDVSVASIAEARETFATTDLRRAHGPLPPRSPSATFRLWNDIWLAPEFRDWNIEDVLGGVTAPALLIQGEHDQYGTLAQIDAIERGVARPGRARRCSTPPRAAPRGAGGDARGGDPVRRPAGSRLSVSCRSRRWWSFWPSSWLSLPPG